MNAQPHPADLERADLPGAYARQVARLGGLTGLQRQLHAATTIGELLARASVEAPRHCGFARGVVLTISEGKLSSSGVDTIQDPACDALRRHSLAEPIPLASQSEEAELVRQREGLRSGPAPGASVVKEALALDDHVVAAIVPENRAVALLVLDRPGPPVEEEDRCAVELFAHLLTLAVERLVLRLRMQELATELRHLTASAHALMQEALEAPVVLAGDHGIGAFFTATGQAASLPPGLDGLLSEREHDIAALMSGGCSNREIGEQLHLAPDTVKAYVARLVRKLGATNRVDAVARYVGMTRQS